MNEKEELVIAAASKVHEDWCAQELQAFYSRVQKKIKHGITLLEVLRQACYKGEQKRNEVSLDIKLLSKYQEHILKCTDSFEDFMFLVREGVISIKRFTGRTLTEEEQIKAGENYRPETSEENILREFTSLSSESKKENLEAAIGAFNVYVELSKAGITIEQMENDENIKNIIGLAIHTDWLKRNVNHQNESLKVPYSDLEEWTKGQDLTVFNSLLNIVKQNRNKYIIEAVSGFVLPNYIQEEEKIIKEITRQKKVRK